MEKYILKSTNKIAYKSIDYPLEDRYLFVEIKELNYNLHSFNITFKRTVKYGVETVVQEYNYDEILDITTEEVREITPTINAEDKNIGKSRFYDKTDINNIFKGELGTTISKTKNLEIGLLTNIKAAILYDLNNDANFQELGVTSFEFI